MGPFQLTLPNIGKAPLIFSWGELARQANGSIVVSYADTVVLVTVCVSKEPSQNLEFLPLVVEYQERTYAMGKIPGGFIKREGRPKDTEILCARLIDRPLRPLFPKGFLHEVQIIGMVLSSDGKNDPDVLSINGASCALLLSDIPFTAPVGAVRIGKLNGEFIVNPTYEERDKSSMDIVIAGSEEKIIMMEGKFREVKEEEVLEAIKFAHPFIREIINAQIKIREKVGKEKANFPFYQPPQELADLVKEVALSQLEEIYGLVKKEERESALSQIVEEVSKKVEEKGLPATPQEIKVVFYEIEKRFVREKILKEKKRPDSRKLDEVRSIECKVSILPRTHGSAIFTRGQTQALAITTLGTSSDEQLIEALEGEKSKHFMLHYTFPPFSVGETKPLRGPTRREIGHGALAEKSLLSVIPPKEEFPYTIRVVSEILESNGSSSMATVSAASLSLMDAGVPIKKPVGGIALGLVKEGSSYAILTDIAGVEDHYGDMDFKVAGTEEGVTAIQLDLKIDGLDYGLIEESLKKAKQARLLVLKKMNDALALPREGISKYAPKIKSFKIDLDKIGEVIGPGGKTIRRIIREYNVTVDIDDETGTVSVVAETEESLNRAVEEILNLTKEIQVGDIFTGKITKIVNFGAFCEIIPGKIGLIHISEISDKYVKEVRDFVKEGDIVRVKVINIDSQGRLTLSMKQVS
ncbi:MAG: polyribonucleotide nucleotidyltransferase [Candidatus Omnitrophota bacterium]|nr:MAG: polyribonucleotide nucleotidyltransferase [Candidatus Omnitrophota bacterium]